MNSAVTEFPLNEIQFRNRKHSMLRTAGESYAPETRTLQLRPVEETLSQPELAQTHSPNSSSASMPEAAQQTAPAPAPAPASVHDHVIRSLGSQDTYQIGHWSIGLEKELPAPHRIKQDWLENTKHDVDQMLCLVISGLKLPERRQMVQSSVCMAGTKSSQEAIAGELGLPFSQIPSKPILLKPSFWIFCNSKKCRKPLKRFASAIPQLTDFLARHNLGDAHVEYLEFSTAMEEGPKVPSQPSSSESSVLLKIQSTQKNFAPGTGLEFNLFSQTGNPTKRSTIGGVISVDGLNYGLTTAHAIVEHFVNGNDSDGSDSDSDEQSELGLKNLQGAQPMAHGYHGLEGLESSWIETEGPSIIAYKGRATLDGDLTFPTKAPESCDFLLVSHESFGRDSNKFFASQNDSAAQEVVEITPASDLIEGEVSILSASPGPPLRGYLLEGEASILFGGSIMTTRKVQTGSPGFNGMSGSWVLHNGKLCGIVYAKCDLIPYLFILPVENVLKDISNLLGVTDVRLPKGDQSSTVAGSALEGDIYSGKTLQSTTTEHIRERNLEFRTGTRLREGSAKQIGSANEDPEFIKKFMKNYQMDFNEYTTLAEDFKSRCQQWLESEALLSDVTSRAKDPANLRKELLEWYNRRPEEFNSEEDILKYIVDMSRVRIALYDSRQMDKVKDFLHRTFNIKDVIEHPTAGGEVLKTDPERPQEYRRRFNSPAATSYYAVLKEEERTRRWSPNDKVEIQVMTVLYSAWSEIEHKIISKQLSGRPSRNEQQLLDGLNGLVNLGELYMENFNAAYEDRVKNQMNEDKPFTNRYQLGSFLHSQLCEIYKLRPEDFTLSSVETLRLFLELPCVTCDTPSKLAKILHTIDFSTSPEIDISRDRKRPNGSLVIMAALYSNLDLETQAKLQTDQSTDERCRIMISTIITLDEMFAPFDYWERQFTDPSAMGYKPHERLEQLDWLMHDNAPRTMILDGYSLEESDEPIVDSLWHWFENHPKEVVRFVFNISRLGVVGDLRHDISVLERIWRVFESFHQGY